MSDNAGASPRRRGWLAPVLTVSLIINLFLIGAIVGTVAYVHSLSEPNKRFAHVAEKLQLTPEQNAVFDQFVRTTKQRGKAMRESNHQIWSQIGASSLDKGQIKPLIDQTLQNRQTYQTEIAASLEGFLDALTPEQRTRFVDLARAEAQPPGPMRILKGVLP